MSFSLFRTQLQAFGSLLIGSVLPDGTGQSRVPAVCAIPCRHGGNRSSRRGLRIHTWALRARLQASAQATVHARVRAVVHALVRASMREQSARAIRPRATW